MMNYFSALHEYDLEIRLHRRTSFTVKTCPQNVQVWYKVRRTLYQTSAFCGHVFTVKLLLKNKNTWAHDRKQMWLPDAHLCYLTLM